MEPSQGKELLGDFVSELFLCAANENLRRSRRQRQAEGIAEAKPLPDNFAGCCDAWQRGEMTAVEAAESCGMSRKSFYYRAAVYMRDSEEHAV